MSIYNRLTGSWWAWSDNGFVWLGLWASHVDAANAVCAYRETGEIMYKP